MVPKPGDVVDFNPLFKKALCDADNEFNDGDELEFDEDEDGHFPVVKVNNFDSGLQIVSPTGGCFLINPDGTLSEMAASDVIAFDHGFPRDAQVFIPIAQCVKKVINLKAENTKIGSTHCAACGGLLKDLGMGATYKFCPKCEP
jgi:hypothetical protein